MKKTILPICVLSAAVLTASAWGEGFEAPAYQAGQELEENGSWSASGTAGTVITQDEAAEGSQSLQIADGSTVTTATHPGGIKFYQFHLLPTFVETATAPTVNVGGAEFSFIKTASTTGGVSVYLQPGTPSVLLRSGVKLATDSSTSEAWVLVTVRVDGDKKTWDLYLDGEPVAADQALSTQTGAFSVTGTGGVTYLDDYSESVDNPLFPDADHDGIPDAEEKAYGMNAFGDDRNGDLDGDGISNVNEFFSAASLQIPGTGNGTTRMILYVDNINGSDQNSGRRSYNTSGSNGPKASIKAAMRAASSGSIITVLKGTGSYQEDTLGIEGKDLTIRTVEPINIK